MIVDVLCQYCKGVAELMSSERIYNGRNYGLVWACLKCGAWVGVHKGTDRPLGILANAELRTLKMRVHQVFDRFWQAKKMTRTQAYRWLAELMQMECKECHIGMFNETLCQRALDLIAAATGLKPHFDPKEKPIPGAKLMSEVGARIRGPEYYVENCNHGRTPWEECIDCREEEV